jgi:hypothetical protein
VKIIQLNKYALIFRRGCFNRIAGPGLIIVLTPFEKATIIEKKKLDKYVPNHQKMSREALFNNIGPLVENSVILQDLVNEA